ncbi:MAG: conjugal transfer protein TraX [Clostridia bacterium]|nr:conjugal transfer protein TraX [Clostridia bacterium]
MSVQNKSLYFNGFGKITGISSSVLKILAILLMCVDHFSVAFFGQGVTFMRLIGRIAFPLFAFMVAEGARRTKGREKYMLRLLVFALVSEVPFDYFVSSSYFDMSYQNVFFTLFFGLFSVWCYELLKSKKLTALSALPLLVSCAGAALLNTDYSATGVICIFIFYVSAQKDFLIKLLFYALAIVTLSINITSSGIGFVDVELYALTALIPIFLYNGKKGFKMNKYFFYAFYPVHMLILKLLASVF